MKTISMYYKKVRKVFRQMNIILAKTFSLIFVCVICCQIGIKILKADSITIESTKER